MKPEVLALIIKLRNRKTKPTWKYISRMVSVPASTCWLNYQKHLENMAVTADQHAVHKQPEVE